MLDNSNPAAGYVNSGDPSAGRLPDALEALLDIENRRSSREARNSWPVPRKKKGGPALLMAWVSSPSQRQIFKLGSTADRD